MPAGPGLDTNLTTSSMLATASFAAISVRHAPLILLFHSHLRIVQA
jgi:hypothetical protein